MKRKNYSEEKIIRISGLKYHQMRESPQKTSAQEWAIRLELWRKLNLVLQIPVQSCNDIEVFLHIAHACGYSLALEKGHNSISL